MNCGSPVRPPPRRRPAMPVRWVLRLFCLALVILAVTPGPARSGNRCSEAGAARMERVDRNGCARAGKRAPRGDADVMSFIFFVGILFAVLVVPVALVQQRDAPNPSNAAASDPPRAGE